MVEVKDCAKVMAEEDTRSRSAWQLNLEQEIEKSLHF